MNFEKKMSSVPDGKQLRSGNVVSSPTASHEDPWPLMEDQVVSLLKDLAAHVSRIHEGGNQPNRKVFHDLMEDVAAVTEAVADMRFAFDTAMEHPELFSISTEELMNRSERLRMWEREVARSQVEVEKMRRQLESPPKTSSQEPLNPYLQNNNQFIQSELDVQHQIAEVDNETIDRLHGGIQRVKVTAQHIHSELDVQDHIIDNVDQGLTRLQSRMESVMKKVGNMIDATSDKGKIIIIVVLMLILMALIGFLL